MPTLDDISKAADVLDALFNEGAHNEVPELRTNFSATAHHLQQLIEKRTPKPPKKPKVYLVNCVQGGYIVYAQQFGSDMLTGVYFHSTGEVSVTKDLPPITALGTLIYGGDDD